VGGTNSLEQQHLAARQLHGIDVPARSSPRQLHRQGSGKKTERKIRKKEELSTKAVQANGPEEGRINRPQGLCEVHMQGATGKRSNQIRRKGGKEKNAWTVLPALKWREKDHEAAEGPLINPPAQGKGGKIKFTRKKGEGSRASPRTSW